MRGWGDFESDNRHRPRYMRSNRLRSSREGLEAVGVSKAGGNRRL